MAELNTEERLAQAQQVLDPVVPYLMGESPLPGDRPRAEAFLANAPSLYGHQLPFEQILASMDIGVSAIQADPCFGGGYAWVAGCLYRIGFEDTDIYHEEALANALLWARLAVKIDPACRECWEALGEVYCFQRNFAEAEKAMGEVYRRWGDGDTYARLAFLFFRLQGDQEQAINWGALAWQQEWDTARLIQTLFALGQLYRDSGRTRQAANAYRVLCEHDHNSMWGHHFWAQCEFAEGNLQEASEINLKAIQLGGGHVMREFQETLKRAVGRAKLIGTKTRTVPPPPPAPTDGGATPGTVQSGNSSASRKITTKPGGNSSVSKRATPKSPVVPPPPPAAVVPAPPPISRVGAPPPPPPVGKVVAAPPPAASSKVQSTPPMRKGATTDSEDPPVKKQTRPLMRKPPK
ncbi:MAG: hypothetical protein BroJett014_30010 [Planctomycetota bacterium]|nr:MAG: hypothetical protein BroJett014_30010 [Planctomycetota bacterium]